MQVSNLDDASDRRDWDSQILTMTAWLIWLPKYLRKRNPALPVFWGYGLVMSRNMCCGPTERHAIEQLGVSCASNRAEVRGPGGWGRKWCGTGPAESRKVELVWRGATMHAADDT